MHIYIYNIYIYIHIDIHKLCTDVSPIETGSMLCPRYGSTAPVAMWTVHPWGRGTLW